MAQQETERSGDVNYRLGVHCNENAVKLIAALRYKLRMFGVPIDGPTNMFCDNKAVYKNASMPESQLRKKHHSISYHMSREAVADGSC